LSGSDVHTATTTIQAGCDTLIIIKTHNSHLNREEAVYACTAMHVITAAAGIPPVPDLSLFIFCTKTN